MSAGQREKAENIPRYDDIPYGTESKWQRLDVYRPKKVNGKLPVISWLVSRKIMLNKEF